MIDWLSSHPLIAGIVTFLLAWVDWQLTILQERERQLHYADLYQSKPTHLIPARGQAEFALMLRSSNELKRPKTCCASIQ